MKAKQLFFLVFINMYVPLFAQNKIVRQAIAGGSGDDRAVALCVTKDKTGLLTTGYSNSDSGAYKPQNSRGGYDYYVIKTPVNNKPPKAPRWSKTIGGAGDDVLVTAVATQDRGFLLGGYSNSNKSGEKTANSNGLNDYWLVKLNESGKIIWDKTMGDSNDNILQDLDETTDGGFIMTGYTQTAPFTYTYTLTKTDNQGNVLWEQPLTDIYYTYSVKQTRDNGFILTVDSSLDIVTRKYNEQGQIQWSTNFGYRHYDDRYAAKQTGDGGYMLYGTSAYGRCESCGDGGEDYDFEWLISKMDSFGQVQWKQYRAVYGDNTDFDTPLLEETYDHHYIFGVTAELVYSFLKVDNAGNFNWEYEVGSAFDRPYRLADIKEIRPNRYVVAGYTPKGTGGVKTLPNLGGNDYWDIEMVDTSATSSMASRQMIAVAPKVNSIKSFFVYPNPATNILHIQTNGSADIIITNAAGRALLTKSINNTADINISRIVNGTYYIQNKTTGEVQKVVVMH